MKKLSIAAALVAGIVLFYACNKKETLPSSGGEVYLDLPAQPYRYFPQAADSEVANRQATLGRVLFYERALSINNSVACASCHHQQFAFADNVAFSRGFENKLTGRNSLPIQNLNVFLGDFVGPQNPTIPMSGAPLFWDGRESDIQSLVMRPITNHVEMGISDPNDMVARLKQAPYYPALFQDAYGDGNITVERIANSMAMFMISINARSTRFDQFQQTGTGLTAQEMQGMNLFNTTYGCNNCHNPTVGGYGMNVSFMDIGLESRNNDNGLSNISRQPTDKGKFKIPNLRNVALTAPYMHDGRFNKLEDVLEHYSHGIRNTPNLDERLKESNGQPIQMNIPDSDKKALIAFLNSLTDYEMVTDSKFASPFKTK